MVLMRHIQMSVEERGINGVPRAHSIQNGQHVRVALGKGLGLGCGQTNREVLGKSLPSNIGMQKAV